MSEWISILEMASNDFDMDMFRVESYLEAVDRQLEINRAEAELKVMKESGTEDDLAFLQEAAEAGAIESIRKAIDKIIEAIKKFFSDIKDKVIDMVDAAKNDKTLEAIEKKIKLLPLIGKKKVEVEDYSKQEKAFDKAMSGFKKLIAKGKAGNKVKEDEVDAVENTFMEEHGKAIGVAAAVTVTVAAAIALYKAGLSKLKDLTNSHQKDAVDTAEAAKAAMDRASEDAKIFSTISASVARCAKTVQHGLLATLSNMLNAIKHAVAGAKNTKVSAEQLKNVTAALKNESVEAEATEEVVNESAEETQNETPEEVAQEDATADLEKAAKEAEKEIASVKSDDSSSTPATEDAEEAATSEASVWDDILGGDVDAVSAVDAVPTEPSESEEITPVTPVEVPQTDVPAAPAVQEDLIDAAPGEECGVNCASDAEACNKECGDNCACNTECDKSAALEAAMDKIFNNPQPITFEEATKVVKEPTTSVDTTGLGDKKESNEKLVNEIFNKIRSEVNKKEKDSAGQQIIPGGEKYTYQESESSVYDSLVAEIEKLK